MRALVVLMLIVGCKSAKESPPPPPPPKADAAAVAAIDAAAPDASERAPEVIPDTAPARRIWVPRIDDAPTFDAYSKQLGNERFAKFVIDLKTDAIYYFDVTVYPVHKDFIFGALYKKPKTKEAVRVFDRNYGENKTDFMMCYLVHHLSQDQWTFAFWDGDRATAEHVRRAYKRMKETFYLGGLVKFRPDSDYQEGVAKKLGDVPFILNDQLYKLATFTAFNKGTAVGKLRVVPPDAVEADLVFEHDEIVILAKSLSDITPVAGIISETFTSPLAHVVLRAKGWGIPNVGQRDAATRHADLVGKWVYFEAKDAGYELRVATDAEIEAAQKARSTQKSITIPKADLAVTTLATLDQMRAKDIVAFGAKAANLGEIVGAGLANFQVPPGFGVPFHYYEQHIKAIGLDKQIDAALGDDAFVHTAAVRRQRLAAFQKAIVDAPVSAELRAAVETALAQLPEGRGVFVRSSTNAEDLPDFNGAGVYDTIPNVKGTDAVLAAIKQVWASTWKTTAFEARSHAGIAEREVYSAVLVQTGVDATAAGVLVTVHPTDPTDEKNYTVNAKSGLGISVVDGRKVPESLIVSWYNHGIRVLSRSDEDTRLVFDESGGVREVPNPHKGKPVLTNKMAIRLADTARQLTKLFRNNKLDIEWVYAGDDLYIVQTRPLVNVD